MELTKIIFKYYDASEKLSSGKETLVILKAHPVSHSKHEPANYYLRRRLDYRIELITKKKEVSTFERLVSRYERELIETLKKAGVEPEAAVDLPLSHEKYLKVWYTRDGSCRYKKE